MSSWLFIFSLIILLIKAPHGLANLIADSFRFPLEGDWAGSISQDFGVWNNSWGGYHLAEDASAPGGSSVFAAANGVVKFASTGISGYGGIIIIEHYTGSEYVTTLCGHLSARLSLQVSNGQEVSKGELIGYIAYIDEPGGQYGEHLHFGIRKGSYVSGAPYYIHYYDPNSDGWKWKWTWVYLGYTKNANLTETEKLDYDITHDQMKEMWYDPYDFVKAHEATGTVLTLQQAASQGLIELESKGGYFGDKVTFISGPNPENVIVKIRKGDAILNKDHSGQNLVASKDLEIFIPAGQIVRLGGIWVVCLDFHQSIPYSGDKFDVTYNIRQWDVSSAQMLYRLLEVIDQEGLHEDSIAQEAVWKVTDNSPVSSTEAENLLIRAGIDPNADILDFPHLLNPNSSSPETGMVIPPDLPIIPLSLESLIVYPNPFRSVKHTQITFEGLTANASIRIFTLSGELVYEGNTAGWFSWKWNVKNMYGEEVARGIYIYLATDNVGTKRTGKIAIIK